MLNSLFCVSKSFLTKEECDTIVKEATEKGTMKGVIGENSSVVESIRDSDVSWIDDINLKNKIMLKAHEINTAVGWNFDIRYAENIQFTLYSENQTYNWHVDSNLDRVMIEGRPAIESDMVRKISLVIPLTEPDEYEGGEFFLYDHSSNKKYRMNGEKGDIIAFPSFLLHKVAPVVSGTRMTLVCWINGPAFK